MAGTEAVTVTVPKMYLVRCVVVDGVGSGSVIDDGSVNVSDTLIPPLLVLVLLLLLMVDPVCLLTLLAGSVGGRLGVAGRLGVRGRLGVGDRLGVNGKDRLGVSGRDRLGVSGTLGVRGRLGVTVGLVLVVVTGGRPGPPHWSTLTTVVVAEKAVRVTLYVTVVSYVEELHS